jgi:hypothetical protein
MTENIENTENTPKFPSNQSFDVISSSKDSESNKDIDSRGNNHSYDILPSLPSEADKMEENIDSDNEELILDDKIIDETERPEVPSNTPNEESIENKESYFTKKEEINESIKHYKETSHDIKSRRQIKSLERHLTRLEKAEASGILFVDFRQMIINEAMKDKHMNESVKNLYVE